VGDELSTNQLTNELGQVGSDSRHPVLQVLSEVLAVKANLDNLVGKSLQVHLVLGQDFSTH